MASLSYDENYDFDQDTAILEEEPASDEEELGFDYVEKANEDDLETVDDPNEQLGAGADVDPDLDGADDEWTPPAGGKKMAMEDEEGDQKWCIDPWKGAVVEPTNAPSNNPAPPSQDLKIDWVYGYRGYDSRNNLVYNENMEIVYPSAGVAIVFDSKSNTQKHFLGHTDDIVSLAQNPNNPNIIATGQVATLDQDRKRTHPHICIWDSSTMELITKIRNAGKRAVSSLSFSCDGKYLASVGNDDDHSVCVWDWKAGTKLAEEEGDSNIITQVQWSNKSPNEFTTVGKRHIYFWTFDGGLRKRKAQLAGKYPWQTFYTVSYSISGYACVGSYDGGVWVFAGGRVRKVFKGCHDGRVFCIANHPTGLVSGGSDKYVNIYAARGMKLLKRIKFRHKIKSVQVRGNDLLVGTARSSIYEIKDFENAGDDNEPCVESHFDGELWGCCFHPTENSAISVGEDNQILKYDLDTHRIIGRGIINEKRGKRRKRPKACSTSRHPPNQMARAIEFSPDGSQFIIGTNSGEISVYETKSMEKVTTININRYGKQNTYTKGENWIQTIKFSPSGKTCAVGTHGMVVVFCDVAMNYKVRGKIKTHNASITHMDWSKDGTAFQSTCGAYELLFHNIDEDNLRAISHETSASAMKDVDWDSQSCIFGWPVVGIWESGMDYTDINSINANPDRSLLVGGDDWGRVNLYNYPCQEGNQKKSFRGHSSHVVETRFSPDGQRVLSSGGGDKTLILWRVE